MQRKNRKRDLRQKELDAERDKMVQTDRLASQRLDFEKEKLTSENKL